jgi:hypothetical protein
LITVAAVNNSSLSSEEVTAICRALSVQATHHIAPAWGLSNVSVQPRQRQAADWQLLFLENSDQAGALGYHDDLANGHPVMKVFVQTCKEDGVSASACASHELAEALVDPYLTTANFDGRSKFWATEIGDPAQSSTYEINGFEVQDFITPQWFMAKPPAGSKFDHTGAIAKPFEVPSGGYSQFLDITKPSAGWQEIGMELGAGHARPSRRRDRALAAD